MVSRLIPRRRSEHADDVIAVNELEAAELAAAAAALGEADGDQPGTDHGRRCRTADRRLLVGEDGPLVLCPLAEIRGATADDDVRLALAYRFVEVIRLP